MDGEEEPHEYLRYIIEGKKNCCITQEHAEDSFEASNCYTSNIRSKIRNIIAQLTPQDNPIDFKNTSQPQF